MLSQTATRKFIEEKKRSGMLIPAIHMSDVIMCGCGDGTRFRDLFLHVLTITNLVHPIILNGGPLLIADNEKDPLRQGDVLIANIKTAIEKKGFKNILLTSHWPCAIANDKGYSIEDVFNKTVTASRIVKARFGKDFNVYSKLHVDYEIRSRPSRHWFSSGKHFLLGVLNGQVLRRTCDYKRSYLINDKHSYLAKVA